MQTKLNTLALRLVAVILAVSLLSGCCAIRTIKKVKMTVCKIESIIPEGLKSAKILLGMGFDNPSSAIDLSGLCATVNCEGVPVLTLKADDVKIDKKSSKTYSIPVTVQLGEGFNLLQTGKLLNSLQDPANSDKFTIDVNGGLKVGKAPVRNLKFEDLTTKQVVKALEGSGLVDNIKLDSWKSLLSL